MCIFISDAVAATTNSVASTAQASNISSILLMLGFILIFYFMLWRPQSKRAKEQRALIDNLAKDDEVVTSGGILGKIMRITDDFVELKIAEGVEIKIQKPAVVALLPKGTLKH